MVFYFKAIFLLFLTTERGIPLIQFPAYPKPVCPAALRPPSLPPFLFRNRRRLSGGRTPPTTSPPACGQRG